MSYTGSYSRGVMIAPKHSPGSILGLGFNTTPGTLRAGTAQGSGPAISVYRATSSTEPVVAGFKPDGDNAPE